MRPSSDMRQVDDLLDLRVGVVGLAQLAARRHGLVEGRRRRLLGDHLGDAVADRVGHAHDAGGVARGGARRHGAEGDDLRHAVAAVLLGHVVDDFVAARDREVDVDVGHALAARVEEALEEQVVLERIEVGDAAARTRRCCPAAEPRPGPTAMPLSLANLTKSQTMRK